MDGASLEMRSALVVITMALLLLPGLASAQQPHDDLSLLISKFGPPDEMGQKHPPNQFGGPNGIRTRVSIPRH